MLFRRGALNQGILYEEMNLAQLWKLPIIYACENNHYTSTRTFPRRPRARYARARPPSASRTERSTARTSGPCTRRPAPSSRARNGEGPAFLLLNTYRYHGHHVGDIARAYYRPEVEEQQWVSERDPIKLLSTG